mmetsp:Transcript_2824/g.7413  ORF Transcript_2824/g.7413 Transcript_2824/m.7413 type:complete len:111 (+) Transcript_2824:207-539(+)|eukprot:CAMPEP_0174903828 /NCGR_PEP_ID=MMETSP0167-20121228/45853_1 /TAXON_ID=38298 /ORGANISM="Rhodella maculata, Strain CCMP736" /LENGTH=110 /DNA_ID=CAMNT_0016146275 /DNA_START=196 /DNA_END=528 /DNA_ORIENTATION=-
MERCAQCQRGGVKLADCGACESGGPRYCSKECQILAWKSIHKYACKGSKSRLEKGSKVCLQGLAGAKQHNGKIGVVDHFVEEKGRICIFLDGEAVKLGVRPQNVKKVEPE